MMSRPRRPWACLLLALLVGVGVFQAADALSRTVSRVVLLSWDNPATQILDELICESAPPSQAGIEARLSARLAIQGSARVVDPVPPKPLSSVPSSGITRSPPAA